MIPRFDLPEILVSSGVLTVKQRDKAQRHAALSRCRFSEAAVKLGFAKDDDIAITLSRRLNIPYASRENKLLKVEGGKRLERLISEDYAREKLVLPLSLHESALSVAVWDPADLLVIDDLKLRTGLDIRTFIAPMTQILAAIDEFYVGASRSFGASSGDAVPRLVFPEPPAAAADAAEPSPRAPLPRMPATLFAQARSLDGDEVEPDQVVEVAVKIDAVAPPGMSAEFETVFPEGAETVTLYAQVTSRDFSMPAGETWLKQCVVDRRLRCSPGELVFKVRAIGDRPCHSLTISLSSMGSVLRSLRLTLRRKGTAGTASAAGAPEGGLEVPGKCGARLRVDVVEQGDDLFNVSLYEDGVLWGRETTCKLPDVFGLLDAKTAADVGAGLWAQLPQTVREFLGRPQAEGKTLLFVSNGSVAPFEMLRVPGAPDGGFLGVRNPLTRWIPDQAMAATETLRVRRAACIRPVYKSPDALQSAAEEEKYMRTRFGERLSVVRKESEVTRVLDDARVSLFHFAGHADGNPAHLVLEDGRKIEPTRFSGTRALSVGKPLFFLNGCRGGLGSSAVPAMLGDFARMMLVQECTAFVAPMARVESTAALRAAEVFYDALSSATVGEAARRVRAVALDGAVPDGLKNSYLSYAAFAAPGLKLEL